MMPPSHTHHMGGGRVRPSPCLGLSCVTQRHWTPTSPTLKAASTRPRLGRGLAFPICLSPSESCPRPVCCLYQNGNNNFCKALLTWLQVRPGATGMETLPLRVWGSGGGEGSQSCGTASSGGAVKAVRAVAQLPQEEPARRTPACWARRSLGSQEGDWAKPFVKQQHTINFFGKEQHISH